MTDEKKSFVPSREQERRKAEAARKADLYIAKDGSAPELDRLDTIGSLSPADYGRRRADLAEEMGTSLKFLDDEYKERRKATKDGGGDGGDFLRDTEPWPPHRAEDVDTDSEDHIADECRYACMSRPWIAKVLGVRTAGFRPDGSPITTHKRNWKVLAEMSYDDLAKATGHTLDRRERHRERV